jgi:putative dimethyl sulfoxide reductase chaperone
VARESGGLTAGELALARSRSYALLADLFLQGLTAGSLAYLQTIPDIAAVLPADFDQDEAAADHYQLFGFNVFPYESIFLDPAGLLGGSITDEVVGSYSQAGFAIGPAGNQAAGESPDHLGHELRLMAFLGAAEADAWDDGLPAEAARMAGQQRAFLDQHLLQWLPPFVLAVEQQDQPLYGRLARLALDLASAHRQELGGRAGAAAARPPAPDLLADEKTGLREIAAYLLTPPYSGLYLSREDIGRLARAHHLPRGFGDRSQILLNLLRAAADYDRVGEVLADLAGLAQGWAAGYGQMAESPEVPESTLHLVARDWQATAAGTASLLEEMARVAGRLAAGDESGDLTAG